MDKNTNEKNYENDIYLMIPLADNQKTGAWMNSAYYSRQHRISWTTIAVYRTISPADCYAACNPIWNMSAAMQLWTNYAWHIWVNFLLFTLRMIIPKRDKSRKLSALPLVK